MSSAELWIRAASALALIALVLGALKYLLRGVHRGMWPRGKDRLLDLVETMPLSSVSTIHLVRIAERYYALAGGSGHLQVVCEVPVDAVKQRS